MNSEFRSAVAPYIKKLTLTHQQRVTRLYRHSLKTLLDWTWDRDIFEREAVKIREKFRKNAKLDPSSLEAKNALEYGEKTLADYAYPEPYVLPWYPGGATFMRNAPQPLELAFPHGVPKDLKESIVPVHPDQVPYNWRPTDEPIYIDFKERKMI